MKKLIYSFLFIVISFILFIPNSYALSYNSTYYNFYQGNPIPRGDAYHYVSSNSSDAGKLSVSFSGYPGSLVSISTIRLTLCVSSNGRDGVDSLYVQGGDSGYNGYMKLYGYQSTFKPCAVAGYSGYDFYVYYTPVSTEIPPGGADFVITNNYTTFRTSVPFTTVFNIYEITLSNDDLFQQDKNTIAIDKQSYILENGLVNNANAINNVSVNINNQTNSIVNSQNNTTNAINGVNDSINNDNVSDPSNSLNGIKNNIASNGVITQLVVLPITLFSKVLSSVNGQCVNYNLGSLYGHNLVLPCINISNYIGSALWGVIDVLISGLLVYSISKKMVKVFNHLSSMKEGDILDD